MPTPSSTLAAGVTIVVLLMAPSGPLLSQGKPADAARPKPADTTRKTPPVNSCGGNAGGLGNPTAKPSLKSGVITKGKGTVGTMSGNGRAVSSTLSMDGEKIALGNLNLSALLARVEGPGGTCPKVPGQSRTLPPLAGDHAIIHADTARKRSAPPVP